MMNDVLSCLSLQHAGDCSNWALVGALALPHLLYAYIWYFPHIWMRLFGRSSVRVFESMAWFLKGTSLVLRVNSHVSRVYVYDNVM